MEQEQQQNYALCGSTIFMSQLVCSSSCCSEHFHNFNNSGFFGATGLFTFQDLRKKSMAEQRHSDAFKSAAERRISSASGQEVCGHCSATPGEQRRRSQQKARPASQPRCSIGAAAASLQRLHVNTYTTERCLLIPSALSDAPAEGRRFHGLGARKSPEPAESFRW